MSQSFVVVKEEAVSGDASRDEELTKGEGETVATRGQGQEGVPASPVVEEVVDPTWHLQGSLTNSLW